ncbi:DUF11 domain-containing protein [Lentzea alba]|uniref:hypothetical protein n=1 Tax=Lentzea alba TaxID=2714351 RepID=UPI0039BF0C71
MSERSVSRALLRLGAFTTVVALAFGGVTTGALAQEPETPTSSAEPTPTSETSTPSSTPEPTPSSEPAPPSSPPSSEAPAPSVEPTPSSTPTVPVPPAQPDAKPEQKAEAKAEVRTVGPRPDLAVSTSFSKPSYLPGEDLVVTIKVRNVGDAAADGVRFSLDRGDLWIKSGYEDLLARPVIAAGAERVITLIAAAGHEQASSAWITVRATVDGVADPTPGDNSSSADTKIRQDRGTVSGVVYVDANGNGAPDAGEGLTGQSVIVEGGQPRAHRSATVDGQGRFSITDLPTGDYRIVQLVGNPNRYAVKPGTSRFVVQPGSDTPLNISAVKPAADLLGVELAFDRDSYAKSDPVGITVKLTNKTNAPLPGIVAVCNPYGDSPGSIDGVGGDWEALNPDGSGVTVPAGATTVLSITDAVPADTTGGVSIACNFGNDGRATFGYVGGSDYANVTGIIGRARGSVANAETGQPITGQNRIAVLDPVTRKPLGSAELFPSGNWELWSSVRTGPVVFVVPGPWKPKDGKEFTADIKADETITVPVFEVVPGPEVPDPSKVSPDVAVTASFDKTTYDVADLVQVTVKVENKGTAAGYVRFVEDTPTPQDSLRYDRRQWGAFNDYLKQVVLQPGESRVLTITGTVLWNTAKTVSFQARFEVYGDTDLSNNKVAVSADVQAVTGNAEVLAYADKNINGKHDAGEELADVQVTLGGVGTAFYQDKRTDAAGKALFSDIPIGTYYTFSELRDGWVVDGSTYGSISAGATTTLELKGRRPLSDKLSASVNFVKDAYAPGENYELDVTLTNRTGEDLPAVKAFCSGAGEPGEIYNWGPGWGPLEGEVGAGVPLKDGETRTWRVWGAQPEEAPRIGYAYIGCMFGPDPYVNGAPHARDDFRVPGQRAGALGRLVIDDPNSGDDPPAPRMTVVLVDHMSQKVVTRTITDDQGRFQVFNLPVARYDLVVPGPWKVEYHRMNPYFHVRVGEDDREQLVHLVPGPEVEDPGYPLPEDETPGTNVPPALGGGGSGDALAKTGASVLGLGLLGALLVAFGFGASLIGRRRLA